MQGMIVDVLLLVAGIGVLYFGADWLVRGAARLAAGLGVRPIVVGLTIVSFGTSAPELVVGTLAAAGGHGDLALGNVMGSNLANVGLILGITALVRPLDVAARVVWREVPIMIFVTAALYPLGMDGVLGRLDGMVLLLILAVYLAFLFRSVGTEPPTILDEYEAFVRSSARARRDARPHDVRLVVAGSLALVAGGWAIVHGAVDVAATLGISQAIIGVTVVAVGTSLPELATSVVAALRGESDIAVGNVVGSNIFNVAGILGIASLVRPMVIDADVMRHELLAVLAISIVALPLLRTDWRIKRWEGAVLLGCYVVLGLWLV